MFFRPKATNENLPQVTEIIKQELIHSLQEKGVDISKIDIDMSQNKMNISVSLQQKC